MRVAKQLWPAAFSSQRGLLVLLQWLGLMGAILTVIHVEAYPHSLLNTISWLLTVASARLVLLLSARSSRRWLLSVDWMRARGVDLPLLLLALAVGLLIALRYYL